MWACLLAVMTVGLAAAESAKGDAARMDRETLQGTWVVVATEVGGGWERVTAEEWTWVIEGNKITESCGRNSGGVGEMVYTLDPTKSPKAIDLTFFRGLLQGGPCPGIYSLKGDTLTVCFDIPFALSGVWSPGRRPTVFSSKPDLVMYTLKRKKP